MAMTVTIIGTRKRRRMANRNEASRLGKRRATRVGRRIFIG
jgi:hypothetical protein